MTDVVLKPFNTVNRRLRAGDEVPAAEDFSPLSFEYLKESGFIGSSGSPPPLPLADHETE